ncbi:hypothetical protein BH23ACT6_BH23ACT6_22800 [soil metagenome]
MVEYEYRTVVFSGQDSRSQVRVVLAEQAEYGHWELRRVRVYWGGRRKVWLRRRIIRVQRTA